MIVNALAYLNAGLSLIPVSLADKRPFESWKKFTAIPPSAEELRRMFGGRTEAGIAVICGSVSGGLECLDFDNKDGKVGDRISEFLQHPDINKLVITHDIPYEQSPSGGYHFFYRCPEITGNQKLAKVDKATAIETRGEGGYVIVSPSVGYELKYGSLTDIPAISPAERTVLLNVCRGFNDILDDEKLPVKNNAEHHPDGLKPGEDFCRREDSANVIRELLRTTGWTFIGKTGANEQWRRPGKGVGNSASFNGLVFYCFSSNAAPFEPGKGYNLFSVFSLLKHGGNFSLAAKELSAKGYGDRQTKAKKALGGDDADFFIKEITDDDGVFEKHVVDYSMYVDWLKKKGFYKYYMGGSVMFVRKTGNLLEEAQIPQINDVIKDHIRNVRQDMFMLNNLISIEQKLLRWEKLMFLDTLPEEFICDDKDSSWLFFRNAAVKVEKGLDIAVYEYKELALPVWKKSLIDRDFQADILLDDEPGEFERFISNVAVTESRKRVMMSSIGYMLHRWKQQSLARAMVFCDERIPDLEEDANGGTGKSLVAKFIGMYRNTVKVGSKSVDFRSPFLWQELGPGTDLVLFDDVHHSFPFGMLFDVVTGDLRVERKNKTPFVIPFSQSPKFMITTNHTIKGTGGSYTRRKYEIEFAPYYSETRTPRDEFGHDLFTEWSEREQQLADVFAVKCLAYYLESGLPDNSVSTATLRIRQAISETSREFVDFMFCEIAEGSIIAFKEFDRKETFDRFQEIADDSAFKMQTFTRWITKFCQCFRLKTRNRRSSGKHFTLINGELDRLVKQYEEGTMAAIPSEAGK